LLDGLLTLSNKVEQLEPLRTRGGVSDAGELLVDGILQGT
jgi:hypothetical protein